MSRRAPIHNPTRPIAPVHKPKANPTGRDADPRRTIPLNSSAWRKLRASVLAREPLCRRCGDVATDVDHFSGDPSDNTDLNLIPMCHPCHSHKTGRERAGRAVNWGVGIDGWPIDPRVPFLEREKSLGTEPEKTDRPPSFQSNGRG